MQKIYRILLLLGIFLIVIPVAIADSTNVDIDSTAVTADQSKKIAFVSKRNGNLDIFTINADGSDLVQITNNKADDIKPQWSPDGKKMLYISVKKGKHQIWVTNNDGANSIQLTEDCDKPYQPLWSPDSAKIIFVSKNKIFVKNADGGNQICLTEAGTQGKSPSWSPDGAKILFILKHENESYLCLINPEGTGLKRLTPESGGYLSPAWSPDGKKIAYVFTAMFGRPKIFIMNPNGTDKLDITVGDDFIWSPNSSTFVYTKLARREASISDDNVSVRDIYGIFFIKADGNGFSKIITETGTERCSPNWAPDSSKIAYVIDNRLYVYSLNDGTKVHIKVRIPVSQPQWSNDSLQIVCAGKAGIFKKSSIYIASADGSSIQKITNETADDDPVWAPGGNLK